MLAAILADVHVSNATLITILIVLAIICLIVWLLRGRWYHRGP